MSLQWSNWIIKHEHEGYDVTRRHDSAEHESLPECDKRKRREARLIEVKRLRDTDALTFKQIAMRLGVSITRVQQLYRQAHRKFYQHQKHG